MATTTSTITKVTNPAKNAKNCMCVVCNCGLHKCPSRETFKYDPKLSSEYTEKFPGWPVSLREAYKPDPPKNEDCRLEGNTTYMTDFAAKQMPPKFTRIRNNKTLDGCIPEGNYQGSKSEYGHHYVGFKCTPRDPLKIKESPPTSGPFEGTTTQKSDFKAWPNSQRLSLKPADTAPDSGEFYGNTTYNVNYWDKSKELDRTKSLRQFPKVETGKFYDETTYSVGFSPKAVIKTPPMMQKPTLGVSGERFEGDTTYASTFRDWKVQPIRAAPINPALAGPGTRFEGSSTYKTDFTGRKRAEPCPVLTRPKPSNLVDNHLVYQEPQ